MRTFSGVGSIPRERWLRPCGQVLDVSGWPRTTAFSSGTADALCPDMAHVARNGGLWRLCVALGVATIQAIASPTPCETVTLVGRRSVHVVERGETLSSLGARFGIEPRVIARMNSLRPDSRLQVSQQLMLDNRHIVPASSGEELLINIPQRLLFVFGEDVAAYPVAVGRPDWPTFIGPFTVSTLEANPAWDVPPSIQAELRRAGKPVVSRVPPGPANPLGAFWIGLSRPGFGIHSTNAPSSIYRFTTHGCIRLHPDDAERVFRSVVVGTCGRIVYEPLLLTRTMEGAVLLEAHPDIYLRQRDAVGVVRGMTNDLGVTAAVDWNAVSRVLRDRDGVPIDVTIPRR